MHSRGKGNEKAKNFTGALLRLFSEMHSLLILALIATLLAIGGSILAIISPNRLADLTDEIRKGLIPKTDKIALIGERVGENFANGTFEDIEIDGVILTVDDQKKFTEVASKFSEDQPYAEMLDTYETLPESVKQITDPSMNTDAIMEIAAILIAFYLCSAVFSVGEALLMADVSNRFAQDLRSRISKKINLLPLRYFDSNQTGDILSRVTNDIDTVAQSMSQSLSTLVSEIVLMLGCLVMMIITNYQMALTAIIASVLGFASTGLILSKSQKYFKMRQESLGKLNAHIEEVYSGLVVVKTYNGSEEANKKFDILNKRVYTANQKSQFLSGIMHPLMIFVGHFGYVAVCVVGAILTMRGSISFGTIVAFISFVRLFTSPLSRIAQAAGSLQAGAAASERVFEFLDEKEMQEDVHDVKIDKNKIAGKVEFNRVHFGYDDEKIVIKNFNALAKPGQKIAIVGPTGAGKTTMVNLLMKFYDINSGDILIDDISTRSISRKDIHSLFTMVLQDTWMFEGTLRENIAYNHKNVSDRRIMQICETVGLSHFVKTLPDGLDTVISENDSISAGQKQLITIARGMVEDAPLLILDEATSNVDTRTEELVQAAMDKLMEGRTSFIIAHRLSTIRNADLILVMNEGDIIESGKHDELIAKDGFYAKLYNSQFAL